MSEVVGLFFAGDFVRMSATLWGLQRQTEVAMEFLTKWRLPENVKKRAVMICSESNVEEVDFK